MEYIRHSFDESHSLEEVARKMREADLASLWGDLDLRELDAELEAKYAEGFRLLTPP